MTDFAKLLADAERMETLIPEGTRVACVVRDVRTGRSAAGRVVFTLDCEVDVGQWAGWHVKHILTIVPDSQFALGKFFTDMERIGLNKDFFRNHPSIEKVSAALVGLRFTALIGHTTFNGAEYNNFVTIWPDN